MGHGSWTKWALAILMVSSGCATAPPVELDPVMGFSRQIPLLHENMPPARGELAHLKVMIVPSESVTESIVALNNTRKESTKLLNPWALPDLDDRQIYQGLVKTLRSRFNMVGVARDMEIALSSDTDLIMVLETQFRLLPPGEQVTAVRLVGRFVDKNNSPLETIEAQGQQTFPIPWTKLHFTEAWDEALSHFATQLDQRSKRIVSQVGFGATPHAPRFLPEIPLYSQEVAR